VPSLVGAKKQLDVVEPCDRSVAASGLPTMADASSAVISSQALRFV
jgi:hypothetical protein